MTSRTMNFADGVAYSDAALAALKAREDEHRKILMSGQSTLAAPSADLVQGLLGFPASAGKVVTRATAERVAAVLSSVKTMANDIAKMDLVLRSKSVVKGRQRTQAAIDDPLYALMMYAPNRWQTSYEARWFQASQLLTNGNSFFQKIWDGMGNVIELVPLNAWSMEVKWDYDAPFENVNGDQITTIDKQTGKKTPVLCWHYLDGHAVIRKFYQPDLWHTTAINIEGIGVEGSSMYRLGKEAISLLIAAEETAGRQFANGLGMGGFITFPADAAEPPTEEQQQNVVDQLKKNMSGSQNAGKFSIIPFGGKFEKMTWNAQESQLLDTRKWNEETVARMWGGAPLIVKLGLSDKNSTYASSTAFMDEYFNTTLLPFTKAIEQSFTRDVIPLSKRGKMYVKHDADIILRGSPKERADEQKIRILSSQMTPNEARAIEDRDWIEGGDVLIAAANSCVFDPETQEWFIPGQLPPEPEAGEEPTPQNDEVAPDAEGGNDDEDATEPPTGPAAKPGRKKAPKRAAPPKPDKAKARLEVIANALAERVMLKESKDKIDAKFVATVMNVSKEQAEAYIAGRSKLNDEEARAALVALAQGE